MSKSQVKILNIFILISIIISIFQYKFLHRHERDYSAKLVGEKIRNIVEADEVIFLNQKASPALIYYAERNIAHFINLNNANKLLKLNNIDKGIIFYLDDNNPSNFTSIERIKQDRN